MSVPVLTTTKEYNKAKLALRKETEIVCLDKAAHVLYLLVARDMLLRGQEVKAQIVKGY
jgi:hypothetical protein